MDNQINYSNVVTPVISKDDAFLIFCLGQMLARQFDCIGFSEEQRYEVCSELLEQAYEELPEDKTMDYELLIDWYSSHHGTIDTTIERIDRNCEEEREE